VKWGHNVSGQLDIIAAWSILMNRRRSLELFSCGLLILCLVAVAGFAQATQAQVRATDKPFLWRIDGPVPSYLYGTVHVPDPRVLELPEVVRRSLDASDVFAGEIPLDDATQASLLGRVMLPPGQDLRKIAGDDVFARVVKVIGKALGSSAAPGMADILAGTLATMKPWAVMSQIELIEFIPDVSAGRQPLDATLYGMASKAGKGLDALESVEDQIGVFEGFTNEEQVKMLVETLDEYEKPHTNGLSSTQELVKLYLDGDLDALAAEANKQTSGDPALNKKMVDRVIDQRNLKMAAKIAELCAKKPAKSYFFAVGALHYAGDTGIINQLSKRGFKITRLTPRDAQSIARKPAA
jgi:uncharacterized protein YbaP (TraB family)